MVAHPPKEGPSGAPADPLLGAAVGSFRVQRLLGRGGMGSVYLAEHPIIGSKVAIKFLHESFAGNAELVGRFYDEARAVNLIGHENIVGIYDLALLPPARYYIVMEYLDGASLAARLREGRLPAPAALDVLLQLASALRAAHARGVVHRDLKPENVFLLRRHGSDRFVKLVDFGIAKLLDAPSTGRTLPGVVFGTPEYMAPEQCDGAPVDARTDVYALGAMAYELATGRVPFAGQAVSQVLLAHVRDAPVPPRRVDARVSPALERAILRALAKRPEDRFADMGAFAAALEEARVEVARGDTASAGAAPPAAGAAAGTVPAEKGPTGELEVRGVEGGPLRLAVVQAARGGVSLAHAGALPPLLSRVGVVLPAADGSAVEVPAEVVRHVTAADAARWGMPPGFAVQLAPADAAQRAAVERLARGTTPPPAAPPRRPTAAAALAAFSELQRRAAAGAYELLGARPEDGFLEIRERARAVRGEVEGLREWLSPEQQAAALPALRARVDAAAALLGDPAERLAFDLPRGHVAGVMHCVTAGLPAATIDARRRAFLAEHPGAEERARRHLARAGVALRLGNPAGALAEVESALAADPLDLALHDEHRRLKRRVP